jgi:hypothetical protein
MAMYMEANANIRWNASGRYGKGPLSFAKSPPPPLVSPPPPASLLSPLCLPPKIELVPSDIVL